MSEQNTPRPKFDAKFLKACLLRLVSEPHLFYKFQEHLEPDMFETGEAGEGLKRIARIFFERAESETPTIEGLWAWLQLQPSGPEREASIAVFNDIRTDKELFTFSQSNQVFNTFLQWLKAKAFMQSHHQVTKKFNSGSFEDSYAFLEGTLSKLKGISMDEIENASWDTSLDFLEEDASRVDRRFKIGIDDFDAQSALEPQTMTLMLSSTGGGKSMFSIHFIRQAIEQQKQIYVCCVEDRKVSVLRRIYSAITGLPQNAIKNIHEMPPEHRKKMAEAKEKLKKYVTVEFMYGVSPAFIFERIKEVNAIKAVNSLPLIDVVVIDYLQHIAHLSPGDAMHEKLSRATADFKDFVLKNNLIGVTFMQVNRTGQGKLSADGLIDLSTIAGAFNAAFVADCIIGINRSPEQRERNECVLEVLKGREGSGGIRVQVKTEFDKARYNMADYTRLDKMT